MVPQMQEILGTAYLHKSEMENDVYREPGDRCIFPPVKSVSYKNTADSEKAIQYFTSHAAGVDRIAVTKGVAAADYDNDGYPDLYVSNLTGNNFLYHNNHDRTFSEVAQQAGVQQPLTSFAAWFFDYDNDGWPDLFVTSYYMSVEETVRTYLGLPHNAETLKLYRNLVNGKFQDVTAQVGLDRVYAPMGSNFGDVDNDGFLDIYLGTGLPTYAALVPNVLLRNHDGKYFV